MFPGIGQLLLALHMEVQWHRYTSNISPQEGSQENGLNPMAEGASNALKNAFTSDCASSTQSQNNYS